MIIPLSNYNLKCYCLYRDNLLEERTVSVGEKCELHNHYLQLNNKIPGFVNGEVTMTVFKQLAYHNYFKEQCEFVELNKIDSATKIALEAINYSDTILSPSWSQQSWYINDISGFDPTYIPAQKEEEIVINYDIYDFSIRDLWMTKDKTIFKIIALDLFHNTVKISTEGTSMEYAVSYPIHGSFVQSWKLFKRYVKEKKKEQYKEELEPFLVIMQTYSRTNDEEN